VGGYPLIPAFFVVSCAAIVINQIAADARESAMGLFFVISGLPVYYLWARKRAVEAREEPQGDWPGAHH